VRPTGRRSRPARRSGRQRCASGLDARIDRSARWTRTAAHRPAGTACADPMQVYSRAMRTLARLALVAVAVSLLPACTYIKRQDADEVESTLAAAGFKMKVADTPSASPAAGVAGARDLHQATRRRAVPSTPTPVLQVLYAGRQEQYDTYRRMAMEQQIAQEQVQAAEMNETPPWTGACGAPSGERPQRDCVSTAPGGAALKNVPPSCGRRDSARERHHEAQHRARAPRPAPASPADCSRDRGSRGSRTRSGRRSRSRPALSAAASPRTRCGCSARSPRVTCPSIISDGMVTFGEPSAAGAIRIATLKRLLAVHDQVGVEPPNEWPDMPMRSGSRLRRTATSDPRSPPASGRGRR
jgi:hypothetical protein